MIASMLCVADEIYKNLDRLVLLDKDIWCIFIIFNDFNLMPGERTFGSYLKLSSMSIPIFKDSSAPRTVA